MEHRLGYRTPVRLAVTVAGKQSGVMQGEIHDLSAGGAFIRMDTDVPDLRNVVRLSFAAPAAEQHRFECRALIVRKEPDGIGVMFRRLQNWDFLPPPRIHSASYAANLDGFTARQTQSGAVTRSTVEHSSH